MGWAVVVVGVLAACDAAHNAPASAPPGAPAEQRDFVQSETSTVRVLRPGGGVRLVMGFNDVSGQSVEVSPGEFDMQNGGSLNGHVGLR